jgi:hypothetical protein
MFVIVTASADTYITDKLIDSIRVVSGNVGRASTLDIFKLYDESTAVTGAIEISRALLDFDYSRLRSLSSSSLSLNNFKAYLKMTSVSTGQPVPSNFTLSLFPLARDFNEGLGRDIVSFADVDQANFLSSSTETSWFVTGATKGGLLGSNDVDYYTSGNFGSAAGLHSFEKKQTFEVGNEDLKIDVTEFVSASIVGLLPRSSFRLSFTGSQETDGVTRFVKRFASRHVKNSLARPRIEVFFDDSRVDDRTFATFDVSGTLYISNYVRGARSNLVSGSSLAKIEGANCLLLRLSTGSYSQYFTGSQDLASQYVTGAYFSPFVIRSNDSSVVSGSVKLSDHVLASGSVTFDEVWSSLDRTVIFRSGSLKVSKNDAQGNIYREGHLTVRCSGPADSPPDTRVLVRCKFFDLLTDERAVKYSIIRSPDPVVGHYRIVDLHSGQVYIDFDETGTKLSLDDQGNFFEFYSDSVPYGRPVKFEFRVDHYGLRRFIMDPGYTFSLRS